MRVIYRILILIIIFCGAVFVFGSNMQERVFRAERQTTQMQEVTLPVVAMRVGDATMNQLRGYCSNLDAMLVRESITPMDSNQWIELLITENEYNIKKINYEIYETAHGTKMEEGSIIAFSRDENGIPGAKTAKLKLAAEYTSGDEYVVKLTLISNESKRIYYYTRLVKYKDSHLNEKLDFVSMFHEALLDKEEAVKVKKYLETKKNADETDFAHADIHNSLDFLSYGELAPEELYRELPVITEYSKDMASVMLKSYLTVQTTTGREVYTVTEKLRFSYTSARMYLFNYERDMEAVFDPANVSLSKSEFKLGITGDTKAEVLTAQDNTRMAFVRNRTLYAYSAADNSLTTVFTFRQQETDYLRDWYDKHDIRLISMDAAGSVDFLVYGYMNRGEYEGRVAMILYRYSAQDRTVEELAYFPMNTTYELLKETIGDFAYCNTQEIFYFHIYDTIYSYNIITKKLSVLAQNVPEDKLVFSKEKQLLAWQSEEEYGRSNEVHVFDFASGEQTQICTDKTKVIGLFGMINQELVVGETEKEDVEIREDGSILAAFRRTLIMDFEGNSLKDYEKEGYYVIAAKAQDNVLMLTRVKERNTGTRKYQSAEDDFILNGQSTQRQPVRVTTRVTDLMRTEFYLTLPEGVVMAQVPRSAQTSNVVLTEDVTVRVNTPDYFRDFYLTYAYGEIVHISKEAGSAIARADETTGSVITSSGRVIWSRGKKPSSAELSEIAAVRSDASLNELLACVKALLSYKKMESDVATYHAQDMLLVDWLRQHLNTDVMKLSGVKTDEVLYFIYRQSPVIAVNENGSAILITGYDSSGVTAMLPAQGKKKRLQMKELDAFLGEKDYYFIVTD